jgi:hypothetical protein
MDKIVKFQLSPCLTFEMSFYQNKNDIDQYQSIEHEDNGMLERNPINLEGLDCITPHKLRLLADMLENAEKSFDSPHPTDQHFPRNCS